MNLDTLAGQWKQLQGAVLSQWGQWTGNPFTVFAGDQYRINGRIQASAGRSRAPASRRPRIRLVA